MRYLLLIRHDPAEAPAIGPDPALAEDMSRLIEEMTEAGVLVDTGGLRPVDQAVRIRLSGGTVTTLDGPFAESKEVVGGYCLLQTGSQEEAVEWGSRFLRLHGADWTMDLEIRQLDE